MGRLEKRLTALENAARLAKAELHVHVTHRMADDDAERGLRAGDVHHEYAVHVAHDGKVTRTELTRLQERD